MPYERYRRDLEREDFQHDAAQEHAVLCLQRVYDALMAQAANATPAKKSAGLFARIKGRDKNVESTAPAVRGLYMWGGVGRGKTYLVDTFVDALPLEKKQRIHFHSFMRAVHAELKELKQQQDPLRIVAQRFAERARVICLDEFFVSDITDAMLLYGLLQELFAQGVTLVTTSNLPPDDLYKDGLQRARFLPAIDLLKQHLEVINVDGGVDYRLRYLEKVEIYHYPLDSKAEQILEDAFNHIAPEPGHRGGSLHIEGRLIPTLREADGIVWFDFPAICDGPRGVNDYIEIAHCFHTVLISNLPVMGWTMENQARRFVNLVDEFYDRSVNLVISAAAAPHQIYAGTKLKFEFQRTISRLQEMQSREYLERQHLP